jgi:hypothetical protein
LEDNLIFPGFERFPFESRGQAIMPPFSTLFGISAGDKFGDVYPADRAELMDGLNEKFIFVL